MQTGLIKKEHDFLSLWMNELKKRNKPELSGSLFPDQAQALIKRILEASHSLRDTITEEEFSAVAGILNVLVTLQEKHACSDDIRIFLESLQSATEEYFPGEQGADIQRFSQTLNHLVSFVRNQCDRERVFKENISYLQNKMEHNMLSMVGSTRTIKRLLDEVRPILDNAVSVLIEGETGTGKELMAQAIHKNSTYAQGPFVALNCAAIPEELLESELFGYKKGAFTDAITDRPGKVEIAEKGVLFLDEVNELGGRMQAKILRVIQERTVTRIGETRERAIDFKLICATNRNLKAQVDAGHFREDLYYRINVYTITLPPLRERTEDIVPLAMHFLQVRCKEFNKQVRGFSTGALELLTRYYWPGNIRELDNVITRAVLKTRVDKIDISDLDIYLEVNNLQNGNTSLKQVEKNHIETILLKNKGNMAKTARELGITRTTLYSKAKEYKL